MNTKEQQSAISGRQSESKLVFVTGGARSGKSAFALDLANKIVGAKRCLAQSGRPTGSPLQANKKCYLATAQALDAEMEERIARHKAERGDDWDCIEEPIRVAERIEESKGRYDVILFDCLTLWVSNLMHSLSFPSPLEGEGQGEGGLKGQINALISACKRSGSTVTVVSNEVGLGIVPENQLARQFRDIAGTANQLFAKAADEAYFVVSGIPMRLK